MRTIILGSGASRSASYAYSQPIPSPLDKDFFELLQRLDTKNQRDAEAIYFVINAALRNRGEALWASMERMFYTLHLRANLRRTLLSTSTEPDSVQELMDNFTHAIQALLRSAHGTATCKYHKKLFRTLTGTDAIITFNYDLAAERALRPRADKPLFGPWIYDFETPKHTRGQMPKIYKLHGSVNWMVGPKGRTLEVRQKAWDDFVKPGYRGTSFSILLPFWDKKVEERPWRDIWRKAAAHLRGTTTLIIWGYSLPLTDLKALELFRMTLGSEGSPLKYVCVIDPSEKVRAKWREMFVRQRFWQRRSIVEFFKNPPAWWSN